MATVKSDRGTSRAAAPPRMEETRKTHINVRVDFLGQNRRKYDGKTLVKPSKKNTHAFLEKIRGVVDANKSVSSGPTDHGSLPMWTRPIAGARVPWPVLMGPNCDLVPSMNPCHGTQQ